MENYKRNTAAVWYNDKADSDDPAGKYAFQRLRHTWFAPKVNPKFTLRGDDKFYAIGSCFARDLESSLASHNIAVERASLLRAVAHEWAAAHANVDYFPSYEIVQNSDRAAAWEPDLRHVKSAGALHIMELFLQKYFE